MPEGNGWLYEPKWDGSRCLVFRDGMHVSLFSKRGTNLNRHFPEFVAAFAKLKPKRFVLDGEILVVAGGRPDLDSVQLRMHPAESRIRKLSAEIPASFMAICCWLPRGRICAKRRSAVAATRWGVLQDLG